MKRWIFAILVLVNAGLAGSVHSAVASDPAAKIYTPRPTYPFEAVKKREEGVCTVRVVTDKTGKVVQAKVIKSSGHPSLDRHSSSFISANWHGPANATWTNEVVYRLDPSAMPGASAAGYYCPRPDYPLAASLNREHGICEMRATTDKSGKVVKVDFVKSSGSEILDHNAKRYALMLWRGPANTSWTVILEYKARF